MRSEGTVGDDSEDCASDSWPGVHLESDGAGDARRRADPAPDASAPRDVRSEAPGPEAAIQPNTVIADRYMLQRPLGRGGMGVVWEALDTRLNRQVAVKGLLYQGVVDPRTQSQWVERARREAQAIARIGHQNVVSVHDVIEADSQVWIVMELLNARSLADLLHEQQQLPVPQTTRIGLQVLRGLRAVHEAGVLHRDVKPGNVLFRPDGRALLMDFGIATFEGAVQVTRMHEVIGTPMYIAPELVSPTPGQPGGATPASDLWSLGVTLYEMVEGRPPFPGITPLEIHVAVRDSPVRPMRYAGPLSPVIEALLQKDPGRRPDAAQTEEMLLAVTNDSPVLYTPPLHPAPVDPPAAAPAAAEPVASPAAAEPALSSGSSSAPPPASPSPAPPVPAGPATPASDPPSVALPASPPPRSGASAGAPAPRKRRRTWQAALAATLCAGLLGGVGWYAWDQSQGDTETPRIEAKAPGYITFKRDGHATLRIGIKGDQPGLSERDGTHVVKGLRVPKYKGYEIDLGYAIAAKMGYSAQDVTFTEVVTANRASALDRKEVDLILATFSINEERLKNDKISMVGPYYNAGQSFLIRDIHKERFNDKSDLKDEGLQVCTAGGSTYPDRLRLEGYNVKAVESYETCLSDLLEPDTKVFAVSTDDVILEGFRDAHKGEVTMLGHPTGKEGWGVGMRHVDPKAKSRPDLEVCKALKEIIAESTWNDLYQDHLFEFMQRPAPGPPEVTRCDATKQVG